MKGPFVDEYTAGLDVGLSRVLTIQFNFVKKYDGNGNVRINSALPYEAWTVAATGTDPGPDNRVGTSDDRALTIYSVPRTYPTFGQNIQRIVGLSGDESKNRYDAYGVTLNKQYSNNWSFLVSFDAAYRALMNINPRNPNEALYGPGDYTGNNASTPGAASSNPYRTRLPEWSYAFRVSGTYQLPWGLLYAASFTGQSGEWFGRDVQVRDALNQVVNVRVDPHFDRFDWTKLFDNRISKRVKTVGNQSIEGIVDVFNTLNVNTVTELSGLSVSTTTGGATRSGSTFMQPTEIIAPRVFRVSLRYKF